MKITHAVRNTQNPFNKGWIKAKSNGYDIYLSDGTILEKLSKDDYLVLAGLHKGQVATLMENYWGEKVAKRVKNTNISKPINIILNKNSIIYNNVRLPLIKNLTIDSEKYRYIGYPDKPRFSLMRYYETRVSNSQFFSTWFPVYDSDGQLQSHLHVGTYSKGCLTIDINYQDVGFAWATMYRAFVSNFTSSDYCGVITISEYK
jgi:hypothetical protein